MTDENEWPEKAERVREGQREGATPVCRTDGGRWTSSLRTGLI